MKTLTFTVEGMHCSGCVRTIQAVLSAQPGVQQASVSFDDRQARVLFDADATSENRIVAAVRDAGFQVPQSCP